MTDVGAEIKADDKALYLVFDLNGTILAYSDAKRRGLTKLEPIC